MYYGTEDTYVHYNGLDVTLSELHDRNMVNDSGGRPMSIYGISKYGNLMAANIVATQYVGELMCRTVTAVPNGYLGETCRITIAHYSYFVGIGGQLIKSAQLQKGATVAVFPNYMYLPHVPKNLCRFITPGRISHISKTSIKKIYCLAPSTYIPVLIDSGFITSHDQWEYCRAFQQSPIYKRIQLIGKD